MILVRFWAILLFIALLGSTGQAAEPPKPQQNERKNLGGLRVYLQAVVEEPSTPRTEAERENPAHRALDREDFYDPHNPDLARLQSARDAMAPLPRDPVGFPDWMRALREGSIQPRAGLAPGAAMGVLDLDVVMKNTKEMPFVRFPHKSHTMWLDCSNCHPEPFEPRAGAARIAMADIFRGKFCGMCHDRVAFVTFFSCNRCHSVPQDAQPAAR